MTKSLLVLVLIGVALPAFAEDAAFEARYRAARDAWSTPEGKAYGKTASDAIRASLEQAKKDCPMPSIFALLRGIEYRFVYGIRADGRLRDIAFDPSNPSTRCAAGLLAKAVLPPPPRDGWPGVITIRINKKAKGR